MSELSHKDWISKASAINERWQRHGTASAHIIAMRSCFASRIN